MKTKCSFILKASTALVLALLMLFGTVTTSLAAVVDDLAETGAAIYYDFTDITGGANYYDGSTLQYDANAGGKVITGASASSTSTVICKTETGGWTEMKWSANGTNNVVGVWDDGKGYSWLKSITYSEPTVLYFTMGTWWTNTTCYEYVKFTKLDGSTTTLPAYRLDTYISNNSSTLSTAGTAAKTTYFVTVPAGTYIKARFYRKQTDSPSGADHNVSGFLAITDTGSDKNTYATISSDSLNGSWSWVDHTSTSSLTTSDVTSVKVNDTVTLTPSISNSLLNTLDSTSYTVTIDGSAATSGTDYSISNDVLTPLKAGTYSITATNTYHAKGYTSKTATSTSSAVTFNVASNLTALSAPTNVMLNNTAGNVTVDAAPDQKATLSWNSVTNAGSYKIYKDSGSTPVATVTGNSTTTYEIERGNSNSGTYYVVAVPSNTTLYSESVKSTGRKLTVEKVTLTAPTVSPNETDVASGTTVTYTLTDNNTVSSSYYDLQSADSSGGTYSNITGTTKDYTLTKTSSGNVSRYFKATVKSAYSDYFTSSSAVTSTVYVAVANYAWFGDKVDSASDYSGWNNPTYADSSKFSTYEGNNIFSTTVTLSNHTSNAFSFCLINSSDAWYWPDAENTAANVAQSSASAFNNNGNRGNKCYGILANGEWVIYVDQTNEKVWAVGETEHDVTVNTAHGNVKKGDTDVANGTTTKVGEKTAASFTATPATGYSFTGWTLGDGLTNKSSNTTANPISVVTKSSGTYTLTANYNRDSYTITYPSTTTGYTIAGTKPASAGYGDTVSFTVTPDSGYRIKSVKYNDGSDNTITGAGTAYSFEMPAKAVTVSVEAVQIHTVTVVTTTGGTVASGSLTVDHNVATTLPAATHSTGYAFVNWTVTSGTGTISDDTSATDAKVTATTDVTVQANFAVDPETVFYVQQINASTDHLYVFDNSTSEKAVAGTWPGVALNTDPAVTKLLIDGKTYYKYSVPSSTLTSGATSLSCVYNNGAQNNPVQSGDLGAFPKNQAYKIDVPTGNTYSDLTTVSTTAWDDTNYTLTFTDNGTGTVYTTAATCTTNSTSSGTTAGTNKAYYAGTTITVTGSPKSGKWAKVDVTYDTPTAPTSAYGLQSLLKEFYALAATGAGTTTDTYYIKSSAAGQNSVTFQMPTSNATVNVTYTDPPTQTITVSSGRNGSVAITGSTISGNSPKNVSAGTSNATMQAKAGDVLTITANPATGYSVDKIYINGVESNTTSYTVTTDASQTISVTFKVYESDADWYYVPVTDNGSTASHGTPARMKESQYNGQPFAYYHVTGRTEQSQLFYVKNETTTSGQSTGTRYVYLTTANNISPDWWNDSPHAYFYNASGDVGPTWEAAPAMNHVRNQNNDSEKVWRAEIPNGATGVVFKSGIGGKQSVNADLTTTNGCYWFPNTTDGSGYFNLNQWDTPESDAGLSSSTTTTREYFWFKNNASGGEYRGSTNNNEQSEVFAYNATANRFGSDLILYGYYDGNDRYHYAHHNFGAANTEEGKDYYVIVYYPSTNYGEINGKNANNTMQFNPVIVCSTTLPNVSNDTITVYAKDGCINEARGTTRTIGTTTISGDNAYVKNITRESITGGDNNGQQQTITCYSKAQATPGQEITITTEINSSYTNKYVVKGWDINGTTYGIDPTATGGNTYSLTFTVPEDETKLEITPIYWLKNSSGTTIFYIRDFNTVPDGWGDALYYYFWGGSQVNVEAEEKYPGQPVVHEGGQYYTQVPVDVTGITLNNAIWDTIHAEKIMGITENKSDAHYQTYDYDNFKKIITEKTNINSIYFTFEPETAKDNFESEHGSNTINIADFDDTNGNGWEDYKNVLGQDINIFGGITVNNPTKTLYVVSNGYVRNYQGDYATEYSIYYSTDGNTGTKIGDIPGSALIMNDSDSFTKIVYNSAYGPALNTYRPTYDTLKADYANCPVKITYEQGIFAGLTRINTDGATDAGNDDKATRIDGKWDFTTADMMINANIIIQKSDNNGNTWTEDAFSTGNTGTATGAQAYFNNTGAPYCDTHTATGVPISNTDTFKLKTDPNAGTGYVFVGWYRLDDSTDHAELISKNTETESKMSSKATFIARYNKVSEGSLVINHLVNGAGIPNDYTVQVDLLDAGNALVQSFGSSSSKSVTLDSTYIHSDSTDKIKVTLVAKAADGSYIANTNKVPTVTCSQDENTFYKTPAYDRNGRFADSIYPINVTTTVGVFNVRDLFTNTIQNFTVLNYTTTFNKLPTYTINYKYHGRQSSGDSDYLTFTRTITLSPDEAEGKDADGKKYSGNDGTPLRPTYITTSGDGLINDITANAPDENDLETEVFNKRISWAMEYYDPNSATDSEVTFYAHETDPTYTLTYTYYNENGVEQPAKTVSGVYNKLVTLDGTSGTSATAASVNDQKFAYWADANGNPLTSTLDYKMRLIDTITIHPVYGSRQANWYSAIEKITRTHETSDSSDNVFTDFALRFTGFDDNGQFIHINPDHLNDYTVGVAVVYDTEGDNTTQIDEQVVGSPSPFYDLSKSNKYNTAEDMVQLLVTNNKTTARLSDVGDTTYVTRFDADNNNLTNFNRLDLAVKYNYSQNYKRKYDAYAYIINKSNNQVIAVSPVKSGYLYDGTLPVGV